MIQALPAWVRERTTLYCQSQDMPLLEAAIQKHGFTVGAITNDPPADPSCWVLSYGKIDDLPARPTSLILHSWDDEGWRYVSKTYGSMKGLTIAGVSDQVLGRYRPWIEAGDHQIAGILPPPVTEWTVARGQRDPHRLVVAWMGRPLESKGLLSLPYLLAMDKRLIVRAWTGAETAGLPYTRKIQAQTMEKFLALAKKLNVLDRLDLRPLDFDPFSYRHRLEGAHVLLGNSKREGFLMTAAEALSCGLPVVVTRSCGVASFVHVSASDVLGRPMTMNGISSAPPGSRWSWKRRIACAASAGSSTSWNELEGTQIVRKRRGRSRSCISWSASRGFRPSAAAFSRQSASMSGELSTPSTSMPWSR
jgi:glycosyltransferase involved in cell wall biosynthesis